MRRPRPPAPTSLKAIADRLKLLREVSSPSQAAWCRLVNISPSAWNNYERGLNRISLDQALRVCIASGATLDYIYRGMITAGLPLDLALKIQKAEDDTPASAAPSTASKRSRA